MSNAVSDPGAILAALPQPFAAFNFQVEIRVPGVLKDLVCGGAFAECDGLEITHEVKTIREGGANDRQIRLAGPVALGTLTLRRGMTDSFDLWTWFTAVQDDPRVRADAVVVLLGADPNLVRARFLLTRCLPVKIKAPALNAKDGPIAIEEFQLVYETLRIARGTP